MKNKKKKVIAILAAMVVAASMSTTAFAAGSSAPVATVAEAATHANNAVLAAANSSTFTIIAGAASNGSISPSGAVSATAGSSKTFTITPNFGYVVNEVFVDGSNKGALTSYTFDNISINHTIVASFRPASDSAYTTNLLKTDTRSYKMAPGNVYGARIHVEGSKFNQNNVKVYSSRDHIASVTRVTNDVYQIRGLAPGTTYIVAEAGNTHASIRVDVAAGVTQGGEACRLVSIIEGTPTDVNQPIQKPTTPPSTGNYIGEAKAKQIAMSHAGVSNAGFYRATMDYENGTPVYEVEFYVGNKEYDYEINAITGAIISYDQDIEGYTPPTSTTPPATGDIGVAKAKQIALSHAGVSNVSIHRITKDYDDGVPVYEVEFYVGNKEYDYEINAITGAIISYDQDIEGYTPPTSTTPPATGDIGVAKAKQIALSHAGVSASSAYAMEVGMDYERGVKIYEVDFKSGRMEYSYDINAATGAIISSERDYDD